MTIVGFFQELTEIMESYQSRYNDLEESKEKLQDLLDRAEQAKLKNINVSVDILEEVEQDEEERSYDDDGSMVC